MSFKLVQRLEAAPNGIGRNPFNDEAPLRVGKLLLDAGAKVDLAYMNNFEFEDPHTLISAANRIALAARKLKVVTREIEVPRYSGEVHFVCTDAQVEETIPRWEEWAQAPAATLRPTGFFDGDDVPSSDDVVGWWALGEDLIWTRQGEVAEDIRGALVTILDNVS